MTTEQIRQRLFSMQDTAYRDFQAKLIPNISPDTVIGVRTPLLRQFAKELVKAQETEEFLGSLPHGYYDENILHGCILSLGKDFGRTLEEVDRFLPYIDNWAVCDLLSPKVFQKHPGELFAKIREWIASTEPYTVRFAMGMLMSFYLDENFDPRHPAMVAKVVNEAPETVSGEYYVRMMAAWYFATALAKQYDEVIVYLEERRLERWTHNKSIQKAIESRRITEEQKAYLRTLKIK